MTKKQIYQLLKNGYKEMLVTGEGVPFSVFYTNVGMSLIYIMFGNAGRYNLESYNQLKSSFDAQISKLGGMTHSFLILNVDSSSQEYTNELATAKQVCADNQFCWLYDEATEELVVYENQVEEFYGLRSLMENARNVSDAETERVVEKTYDSTGSVSNKMGIKDYPWAAISLIVINIIVFAICQFTGDLLYNIGAGYTEMGNSPSEYYRFITAMFLHANLYHIFSNMMFLYFLALNIEKVMKPGWFLVVFFVSGILGNIGEIVKTSYLNNPATFIGASGAVYGMLGAYLSLLLFKRIINPSARLPLVVLSLAIVIASGIMEANIADMAHFAGLLTGFLFTTSICLVTKIKKQ